MSNQHTTFVVLKALTATGDVVAVAHNKPHVNSAGELQQVSLVEMSRSFAYQLAEDQGVHEIITEHHPLEGDYEVRCPSEKMTDTGVAYALAAIMGWKSPINGAEITYKNGELTVINPFNITNLDAAFTPFKPQEDLAMAMAILLKFKVSIRFSDKELTASFGCSDSKGRSFGDDPSILRELCRRAVDNAWGVIRDGQWDGTIPLSLVKPEPVVEPVGDSSIVTD